MKRIDGDKPVWLMTRKQLKRLIKSPYNYQWRHESASYEYRQRMGYFYFFS